MTKHSYSTSYWFENGRAINHRLEKEVTILMVIRKEKHYNAFKFIATNISCSILQGSLFDNPVDIIAFVI